MTCIRLYYIIKISVCLSNQYIYSGIISQRGDVWAHKTILTLPLFYRSACTKLGKGVVMYLCITGIDCDSFCYFSIGFFKWFGSVVFLFFILFANGRGRDRIAVGFTTAYAISTYHNWCFEIESVRGVQQYVIKFVSDLRQVGGFSVSSGFLHQ